MTLTATPPIHPAKAAGLLAVVWAWNRGESVDGCGLGDRCPINQGASYCVDCHVHACNTLLVVHRALVGGLVALTGHEALRGRD